VDEPVLLRMMRPGVVAIWPCQTGRPQRSDRIRLVKNSNVMQTSYGDLLLANLCYGAMYCTRNG
jgi:hypothetical protein